MKDKAERGTGFIAWTEDDLAKYRERWPLGTRQRLAVEVMVKLGLRRSDACRIGPNDIKGGRLTDFEPQKTKGTTGVKLTLPIHPELAEAIAAMTAVGTKTFLVQEARGRKGQPFKNGESGGAPGCTSGATLPDCTSHGLRKVAAIRLALAGCTVPELRKVFGCTPAQAQVYVDKAPPNPHGRSGDGAAGCTQNENIITPTLLQRLGKSTKSLTKSTWLFKHGAPDRIPRRRRRR